MKAVDRCLGALVALSMALLVTPVVAGGGDANLFLGEKWLSDDRLGDLNADSGGQYGACVSLDFDWPVALAIDLLAASGDGTQSESIDYGGYTYTYQLKTDVDTLELDVGVRKFWGTKARPYVGGGLAWANLDSTVTARQSFNPGPQPPPFTIIDASDSAFGYWLDAGFLYSFGHFNLGVDLRYSDATASLQPEDLAMGQPPPGSLDFDTGGTQLGLLLGYHW